LAPSGHAGANEVDVLLIFRR